MTVKIKVPAWARRNKLHELVELMAFNKQPPYAEGQLWTRWCLNCGVMNGGRVVNADYPMPVGQPDPCVRCLSPDMQWIKLGLIGPDGQPVEQNTFTTRPAGP